MSREIMQQALTALRISTPFAHALEYYEFRNKAIKDIEAELAKPEQEPVMVRIGDSKWFHIQPPRKEWVGLTNEDAKEIFVSTHDLTVAIRLIEAKLKEKNT